MHCEICCDFLPKFCIVLLHLRSQCNIFCVVKADVKDHFRRFVSKYVIPTIGCLPHQTFFSPFRFLVESDD